MEERKEEIEVYGGDWKSLSRADRVLELARVDGYGIQLVERKFLKALLEHDGRILPAYREAFPGEDVEASTMIRRGRAILKRKRVQEYMEKVLKSKEVDVEYILGGIMEIAREGKKDSDRLKAFEMLGKYKKMFGGDGGARNTFNFNINEDTARRLLERRSRYEIGGRGDFIDIRPDEGGVEHGEEEFN